MEAFGCFLAVSTAIVFCALVFLFLLRSRRLQVASSKAEDLPQRLSCKTAKIVLLGTAGSGKSTLAGRLANLLDVPHLDLDTMMWVDGKYDPNRGNAWEALKEAVKNKQRGWVCDGNYKNAMTKCWGYADIIVILDLPPTLRIRRVLNRELTFLLRGCNQTGETRRWKLLCGLPGLLWVAAGFGHQHARLENSISDRQKELLQNYQKGMKQREELIAQGKIPKSSDKYRQHIPLLVLHSDKEVETWVDHIRSQQ